MEAYKNDILDMRRRGVSKQEIALTLRVNAKRIAKALVEWGDPFPLPASHRLEAAKDEIIAAKRRGETRKQIARRYGCGTDTLAKKYREWGEAKPGGSRFDKDGMQRLRDAGLTCREIASRYGCAEATVFAYTCVRPVDTQEEKPVHKPISKYEPGKKYGDYTYLETVHGATTLHRFRHKSGWPTCFTDAQLKEAKVG